ncbi:hypothetical protein [Parachitinimonas caeni]|uniref:Uncharacterized protein n=1 Tax=Parachitinimonas caeni TaxID=3031301 RepID=A0ABT7E4Q6_9NEIS|nr:hypothetical protein [Parachitinimonas caeni]MDK2127029.1 hypothetical protein [Parachitinimonas caeni]
MNHSELTKIHLKASTGLLVEPDVELLRNFLLSMRNSHFDALLALNALGYAIDFGYFPIESDVFLKVKSWLDLTDCYDLVSECINLIYYKWGWNDLSSVEMLLKFLTPFGCDVQERTLVSAIEAASLFMKNKDTREILLNRLKMLIKYPLISEKSKSLIFEKLGGSDLECNVSSLLGVLDKPSSPSSGGVLLELRKKIFLTSAFDGNFCLVGSLENISDFELVYQDLSNEVLVSAKVHCVDKFGFVVNIRRYCDGKGSDFIFGEGISIKDFKSMKKNLERQYFELLEPYESVY